LERRKNHDLPAGADDQIREFQALAQRLLELREQEHQDISRELHDNIAQVLSAAAARISLAREDKMPAWLRQELLDLRAHLQSALADVRTLARDLRPSLLDHFGFAAALEKHADGFRERTCMTLEVCVDPEALRFLDDGDITHLFRLTQEALQNIEEHSGASRAWIGLSQHDGAMHLEIGDDGCSFTPERVTEAQRDGHLGLLGMRERVELLGGKFLLDAAPASGTTIRVTVPVRKNSDEDTIGFHL
jgi:signal transduction histidine kinase